MKEEHFDHYDFCHCLDWKSDFCPETCFRARLTRDLKQVHPDFPWPVSFASFKGKEECKLKEVENAGKE